MSKFSGNNEHNMCVFIFSTVLSEKISHSRKDSARYDHKCA